MAQHGTAWHRQQSNARHRAAWASVAQTQWHTYTRQTEWHTYMASLVAHGHDLPRFWSRNNRHGTEIHPRLRHGLLTLYGQGQ